MQTWQHQRLWQMCFCWKREQTTDKELRWGSSLRYHFSFCKFANFRYHFLFTYLQILDMISHFAHYYMFDIDLTVNHQSHSETCSNTFFEIFRGALSLDSFLVFLSATWSIWLNLSSKRTMTEMVNWALRSTPTCWGSWRSLLHRW